MIFGTSVISGRAVPAVFPDFLGVSAVSNGAGGISGNTHSLRGHERKVRLGPLECPVMIGCVVEISGILLELMRPPG